jgi:peptidyl-prolyl cis-trans isomerase C
VKQIICPLMLAVALGGCRKPAPSSSAATAATPQAASATAPAAAGSAAPGSVAPTPPPPAPPKPVPAVLPDPVASVNGDAIAKAEFEGAIKSVEARAGRPVPADQRDVVYRGVLDDLVTYRLLRQEAAARHVTVSDAELDAKFGEFKKQFGSEAAFEQALKSQHTTAAKLRDDARRDLEVNQLLEDEVAKKVQVKPSDVSTFYEKNPDKFQQPEAVRASHILIIVPAGSDANAKAALRAKAEDVLKAAQSGQDFAALAKKYSQDGSASHGGDLGFFPRGQMVPEFDKAAYALQPGELSGIVETQFGFHIIKCTERRPARTVPFAEVAPQIQQFLEQQAQQEQTRAFVSALKAKSKVEIYI